MSVLVRAVLLIAPVLAAASGAAAGPQQTVLEGVVGPAPTITLTKDGVEVTRLDPGQYTIRVDDRADSHNFHLFGPGVNERTGVEFVGQQTWTVMLQAGDYTYQCDPHATAMRGTFRVGAPSTPPVPQVKPLVGTVGPGKTIVLRTGSGTRAKALTAGRYRITVRDRTARDNLHLVGPGVNRRTGVRFRGTVRWTITLRAGTYRYRSDATKRLRGSFRVIASAHAHGG
ncbi:MAG: hypothetical protein ICV59_07790 [Thermoleophilia bacterium]|nr:hypothetical protein [Thermoleophilia bacterium]